MFYLIGFIGFYKFLLILNLMPAINFKKAGTEVSVSFNVKLHVFKGSKNTNETKYINVKLQKQLVDCCITSTTDTGLI